MALIRAFIAVELLAELKEELRELEGQLKKNSPPVVKWVDPTNIHITLKFLGEIAEDSIEELILAIEESAQGVRPFQLEIRDVGAFPNLERPQVLWVGVKGELEKITRLQKSIESNTEQLGFLRESRAFSPHLTLGRVRDEARPNERQRLGALLADTSFTATNNVDVHAVNLMRSHLTPTGPIYNCLDSVKLK